jgi:hypothetical protein
MVEASSSTAPKGAGTVVGVVAGAKVDVAVGVGVGVGVGEGVGVSIASATAGVGVGEGAQAANITAASNNAKISLIVDLQK